MTHLALLQRAVRELDSALEKQADEIRRHRDAMKTLQDELNLARAHLAAIVAVVAAQRKDTP